MLSHRCSSGANGEQLERAVWSRRGGEWEGSGVGEGYRGAEGREMINDDHRDDGPRWLAKLTEA